MFYFNTRLVANLWLTSSKTCFFLNYLNHCVITKLGKSKLFFFCKYDFSWLYIQIFFNGPPLSMRIKWFLMHPTFVLLFFFSFSYSRSVLFHFENNQLRNFPSVCPKPYRKSCQLKSTLFFLRSEKKCSKAVVMWSQLLTDAFFHVVIGFSKHRPN